MFAHYNQQYQTGGTAVSTDGMVWNGSAWVHGGGHGGAVSNGHSTYSTAGYGPPAAAQVENLVTKYTQYYHQWTARAKEYEQYIQRLPVACVQRTEAQQRMDWAKYYADQASRAAHHYHQNPNAPPPFDLPPGPPTAGQQQPVQLVQQPMQPVQQQKQQYSTPTSVQKKASRWAPQAPFTPPTQSSTASSSDDGPPDGLKRYVHRCLEQCKTTEQRKAIEKETEQVIAKALQNGSLHTTNWDLTPLIPVPGGGVKRDYSSPTQSAGYYGSNSKKQKLTSKNDSYYGPGTGGAAETAKSSSRNGGNDSGYYGHVSSSPHSNNHGTHTPSPTSQHQHPYYGNNYSTQQQQSKYGHYGYGDAAMDQDFIAVPQFGSKKNGKKNKNNSNKYVNPNSTKHNLPKPAINLDDGFQRNDTAMAKRASRFSGPGGNNDVRQATANGIDDRYMGKGVIGGSNKKLDETDYEQMKVKGTCMKLEKQYLRLTAPPKPELVRPLEILQQHLKKLQEEWKSPTKRDYLWFCSEMKSMRQDLTVQHITTSFTVEAYEFHARIALEEGDLNEFNQAQTQLRILYEKLADDPKALENQNEFVAYLVLYFVAMKEGTGKAGSSADLLNVMLSLTPAQKEEDPAIKHALQARAAVADVNYHKFFQLYTSCPHLGGKLMDLMVPTLRQWALQRICKAFKPVTEVEYVLKEVGLKVEKPEDIENGKMYLLSCGCVLNDDGTEINTKNTVVRESDLQEKKSLI